MTEAEITVLVDDEHDPHEEKTLTAHGLSILLRLRAQGQDLTILFDGGPSLDLLRYNAERLKIDLKTVDIVLVSTLHYHHASAVIQGLNESSFGKVAAAIYPPPKAPHPSEAAGILEVYGIRPIYVGSRVWKEQAYAINLKKDKCILLLGCSIHGVEHVLNIIDRGIPNEEIAFMGGGLNLSCLDVFGINRLKEFISERSIRSFLPLHSSTLRVREMLASEGYARLGGVGTKIVI